MFNLLSFIKSAFQSSALVSGYLLPLGLQISNVIILMKLPKSNIAPFGLEDQPHT
jgi:hypothetical protein